MDKKSSKSKKTRPGGSAGGRAILGWWMTLMVMLGIRDRPNQQSARAAPESKGQQKQRLDTSKGPQRSKVHGFIRFSGRNKVKPISDEIPKADTLVIAENPHPDESLGCNSADQNARKVGELVLQAVKEAKTSGVTAGTSADLNDLRKWTTGGNLPSEKKVAKPPCQPQNSEATIGIGTYGSWDIDMRIFNKQNSVEMYNPEEEDHKSLSADPLLPRKESEIQSNIRIQKWAGKASRRWLKPEKMQEFTFPQRFVTDNLSDQPLQDSETHKMMNSLITYSLASSWNESSDYSDTFDSKHIEDLESMINDVEVEEDSLELERLNLLHYVPSLSDESSSEEEDSTIGPSDDQLNEHLICCGSVAAAAPEVGVHHEFDVAIEVDAMSDVCEPSASREECPSSSSDVSCVLEHKSSDQRESESEIETFLEYSELLLAESLPNDKPESEMTDPILDKSEDDAKAFSEKSVSDEGNNIDGSSNPKSIHREATPSPLTFVEPELPQPLSMTNIVMDEQPGHELALPSVSDADHSVPASATPAGEIESVGQDSKKKKGILRSVRRKCTRLVRAIASLTNIRDHNNAGPGPMSSNVNEGQAGLSHDPAKGKKKKGKGITGKSTKTNKTSKK